MAMDTFHRKKPHFLPCFLLFFPSYETPNKPLQENFKHIAFLPLNPELSAQENKKCCHEHQILYETSHLFYRAGWSGGTLLPLHVTLITSNFLGNNLIRHVGVKSFLLPRAWNEPISPALKFILKLTNSCLCVLNQVLARPMTHSQSLLFWAGMISLTGDYIY